MKIKNKSINYKTSRGAVAVEMAILLIPLLVLVFGIAEFGRAISQYNTLVKSVRDSARFVSQSGKDAPGVSEDAKCLAVYGNTDCPGDYLPLVNGLSEDMVSINYSTATTILDTPIDLVSVTITGFSFDFVFNPLSFFGNADTSIPFDPIQVTMRQQ